MLLILNGAFPTLARVTVCAVLEVPTWRLGNATLAGVRTATGPKLFAPTPVIATVWGLFCALSLSVNEPLRAPETVGVKVMLMMQLALGAKVAEQLFVCE